MGDTILIKNDTWIKSAAKDGMIEPFEESLVRRHEHKGLATYGETTIASIGNIPVISYGLSSYGYDLRLSPAEFKVFQHVPGTVVDPKNFSAENLRSVELNTDKSGNYFILPAHSYGLGVAKELVRMPQNVTAICVGKSTYARIGIHANITPIEAGWEGHITLEFSNSSAADCRIYANEGVVQLLFLEGEPCDTSYSDRQGKYQGQSEEVTLARV